MNFNCGRSVRASARLALIIALVLPSITGHAEMGAPQCTSNPIVTNNADNGPGSLRQAIIDACDGGAITFAVSVTSPITLTTADLVIDKNLTIAGPGANLLTVERSSVGGTPQFRIFTINAGNTVTISGLTTTNGHAPDGANGGDSGGGSGGGNGGGILNNGTLTLTKSAISGNSTGKGGFGGGNGGGNGGGAGGGIDNEGTLTLTNTTISGNSTGNGGEGVNRNGGSGGSGGGIFNGPTSSSTLTNTTISGNNTGGGGAGVGSGGSGGNGGSGGGIFNASTSPLTLTNSTISGNSTGHGGFTVVGALGNVGNGGGIFNGPTSSLTLTDSTISGNSTGNGGFTLAFILGNGGNGGGIENDGTVTSLTNCTISLNSANSDGGGIYNINSGTVSTIISDIIAANTVSGSGSGPDLDNLGAITSESHNLIGTSDSNTFVNGVNSDLVGSNATPLTPGLGPLQNNGGPTFTMALIANSPALTNGANPLALESDQRGADFPREVAGHTDIGAFEFGDACPTIDATVSGGAMICPGGSTNVTVTVSGGAPPYTVTLNNNGGTMTGSSPLSFMVSPAAATTYSISSGMDSDECAVTGMGSATVTIDTATTATVSGGGTICPGGSAMVTVSLSGGTSPYSVTLSNSGGTKTGSGPLTFMVSPAMTTTYSILSGTDNLGCSVTGMGSATVTVNSAPMVTLNPASQTIAGGSVTFTAAASGSPTPTVQWQVSTNGGATFSNVTGATGPTLTFTPTPSQSGNKYRAVFTNTCGTAMTTAANLTVFDQCIKDDSSGNLLQFSSVTGQYQFTVCSPRFMLSGTGVVSHPNGIIALTDFKPDRRVSAGYNPGTKTGSAVMNLMIAQGVWQTLRINATNPSAVCTCPT